MENINCKLVLNPNSNKEFTYWDDKIRFSWNGIKIPPFIGKKRCDRSSAIWSPPKSVWLKLNFDGASKGNPSPSGIGCVIRDQHGNFQGKLAVPIQLDTNNVTEFKALLLGLIECSKRDIKNIEFEGASAIVINVIKSLATPNWCLQALLEKILSVLNAFENFSCKHIYREANLEVDMLSKAVADELELNGWENDFRF